MDLRSKYFLGKETFIKVIDVNKETNDYINKCLKDKSYLPFHMGEVFINYILSMNSPDLISPGTKVLVSAEKYKNFKKYKNYSYENTLKDLYKIFSDLELKDNLNIKTAIIISKRVTGNLYNFLKEYSSNVSEMEDALIHISYLYFKFQKDYQAVHGDPKLSNYTWLKLEKPKEMVYNFHGFSIRRKVKHLFFLTDLEFIYSPEIKQIGNYYFNFSYQHEWLDDNRSNLIYVPKISSEPYYDYNVNLFGGYNAKLNGIFPRMFSIDILTLVKMILTHYSQLIPGPISRKFQIYFTLFSALSRQEEDLFYRYKVDYTSVSPSQFAYLLSK